MKRILIYLLIFGSLCAFSGYGIDKYVSSKINHQSPYYLSFASIGAISLESRLDCWAKINQDHCKVELESELGAVLDKLGIVLAEDKLIRTNKESGYHISYTIQAQQITYTLSAETDHDKNETYFLINVISPHEGYDLSRIEKDLRTMDLDWHFYYLYTGKLDHYIDQESRNQLLQVILENMDADAKEVYEDQFMTSITAFSPLFANSITVQNKKYNLQVAAKSTSGQDTALIYIGQPLIIGDY